jgi:hypothetical protein
MRAIAKVEKAIQHYKSLRSNVIIVKSRYATLFVLDPTELRLRFTPLDDDLRFSYLWATFSELT